MKRWLAISTCALALLAPLSARAIDGFSVEAGSGGRVDVWRVGAQWKWQSKWFASDAWHLGGYWDLQAGQWDGGAGNITDIGITPVFRYQRNDGTGPYIEGGIGAHLISDKQITRTTRTSTAFQFGDHIGVGVRFGDRGRYDLGLRLQHHSNASIKRPNPGTNFAILRLQVHF